MNNVKDLQLITRFHNTGRHELEDLSPRPISELMLSGSNGLTADCIDHIQSVHELFLTSVLGGRKRGPEAATAPFCFVAPRNADHLVICHSLLIHTRPTALSMGLTEVSKDRFNILSTK